VVAVLFFCVLAALSTYPLVWNLATHLPGEGVSDNAMFLWNFWWMRVARASGASYFATPYLFAPQGVDLTLHTHAALPAFAGATALGAMPPLAALNLTTLIGLTLNGVAAYWLAWRLTCDRAAAVLAGVLFGFSPYVAAHMLGHFNLVHAWPLPLFALAYKRMLQQPTGGRASRLGAVFAAIIAGVVLGATFYIDYYYVVFQIALALLLSACSALHLSVESESGTRTAGWVVRLVDGLIALDLVVILLIWLTGGFSVQLGPIRISSTETFNPRQILWLLVVLAVWLRVNPRIRVHRSTNPAPDVAGHLALAAVALALASPVVLQAIRIVEAGQYVGQQYFWRSAPQGIDLATLLMGHPFHAITGAPARHLYETLGIDVVESGAWLGIVALGLTGYVVRKHWHERSVRTWTVVAGAFLVWAAGSHTYVAGQNTGMIMPATLLRFVPFVANARIPGRAMVVVYLALAVLAAIGVTGWRRRSSRPALVAAAVLTLALIEVLPTPLPLVRVVCPPLYQTLRERPERGAVVELPLGIGDGFGALTRIDHRVLSCQPVHGRPLVGGVIARLPPNVIASYRADPLIATWIRLSEPRPGTIADAPPADSDVARDRLQANGIDFVVLIKSLASPELTAHVRDVLPLEPIASDEERTLFVIRSSPAVRAFEGDGPQKWP
jgi:hypothetical protein